MLDLIVNYATLASYVALTVDVVLQVARVSRRRSSHDVSYWGIAARMVGCIVLLIKFGSLGDTYLMIGQAFLAAAVLVYLVVVLRHQRPKH